jgi:hypothetical protein
LRHHACGEHGGTAGHGSIVVGSGRALKDPRAGFVSGGRQRRLCVVDEMRRPFFVVALVALVVVVGLEIGSSWMVRPAPASRGALVRAMRDEGLDDGEIIDALEQLDAREPGDQPPGLAIPSMALVDGLLLLSVVGLGLALVIPHRVQGRVIAPVNLIVSLLLIIAGIILVVVALVLLFLMTGLFLAAPFGTIAYLAAWGAFPRGEAQVVLGILLLLKLVFCGFVVAASPRLLKNKGFVALVATSLVVNLLVNFLHGLVPLPLVSILDVLAALVVMIIAIVWAIVVLVGSLIGTIRILRGRRAQSGGEMPTVQPAAVEGATSG